MLVSELITRVNYVLRGIDDDAPTEGTAEYNYWLDTYNRKKDELYRDVTKLWSSSYAVLEVGSITASETPSFELEAEFLAPANYAYIIDAEDHRTEYEIIKPQELNINKQQIYIAGNPQTLYFSQEIQSDAQIIDGTLYLPGYFMPDDVTASGEEILIDDPNWAVMAVAAEIAFNDLTFEDKYPDLNNKANALYIQMVKRNRRGTYGSPRVSPYNVRKIRSPER